MKKLALILLLLIITCIGFADTKKLYFMQGSSNQYRTVGPGFAPVVRGVAQADTRVAWNADPDCLYFDGNDDFVGTDSIGLPDGSDARTVMAWVLDIASSSTGTHHWLWYGTNTTNQSFFMGFIGADAVFAIYFTDRLYTVTREDQWHNYALSYPEGGKISDAICYRDGVPLTSKAGTGDQNNVPNTVVGGANTFTIGRWVGSTLYNAETKIAEVAVFNRALTQIEIQAYYPYRFSGSESGLVRLYHFEEGSGASTADSISGNNANITGAVWSTK